jgi:hypothetical protein
MSKIVNIEGIGLTYAGKLESMGIMTTTDLLEVCGSKKKQVSPRS